MINRKLASPAIVRNPAKASVAALTFSSLAASRFGALIRATR